MLVAKIAVMAQQGELQAGAIEGWLAGGLLTCDAIVRSLRGLRIGRWTFVFGSATRRPASGLQYGGDPLSSDERRLLLQVVAGETNKTIAARLGTTEARVKIHLKDLLRKLRVENRTQATAWAVANIPELGVSDR